MSLSITSTAFTASKPMPLAHLQTEDYQSAGIVTYVASCTKSTPLYERKSSAKERTLTMLANYALKRLAPFGIPNMGSWSIEVTELDYEYFQVELTNGCGAKMGVSGVMLTNNKCGVVVDHGVYANLR